ncbi:urotensin II-related peptide isoform X2 [Erpetoichthys calabaricus]|uniref:urotensin II-related peptide isoform X2 n=1 Tax=Erpetoichthys calabaricus TaxID=27687 RepID=UPI0022341FC5|nr:urotensin II-related peptide isoform X2 [Erpetoichthys calabaricus]
MQSGILISFIITTAVSTLTGAPVKSSNLKTVAEDQTDLDFSESPAESQGLILKILSAFEEDHKSHPFVDVQANRRPVGRKMKMRLSEKNPTASAALLLFGEPLPGRTVKKASPQAGKKPKKRACFWKYCIQN